MTEIVTPDDAAARGARLMVECAVCGRARYVRQAFPGGVPLSELSKAMHCFSCRSKAVRLVAVEPGPSGKWPAERGER